MPDPTSSRHSMQWWFVKVFCELALIPFTLDRYFYFFFDQWFTVPALIPQALILTGGSISLYHYYYLRGQNDNIAMPKVLVMDQGLFRRARHPMYFGDLLVILGFFLFAANYLTMSLAIIGFLSIKKQALIEDDHLKTIFGESFHKWACSTNLLLPHIKASGSMKVDA